MSILEIYNENVVDLLSSTNCCDTVEIRHTGSAVSIVGATWVKVRNEADMQHAISLGQKGRHVAETKLNSSRHVQFIFTLFLQSIYPSG